MQTLSSALIGRSGANEHVIPASNSAKSILTKDTKRLAQKYFLRKAASSLGRPKAGLVHV